MADSTVTATTVRESGWTAFWDRGGWWKAVMLAAGYLGLYLCTGWLVGRLWGSHIDYADLFSDGLSVFLAIAVPVMIGSVLLVVFAASVGWLPRPLFARQPVRGRWWMWIAPALIVATILLRVLGIPWSEYTVGVILATILHALTDPTTFLAAGGIDVAGTHESPLLSFAGLSTIVFLVFALIALVFIRGNAEGRASAGEAPRARYATRA